MAKTYKERLNQCKTKICRLLKCCLVAIIGITLFGIIMLLLEILGIITKSLVGSFNDLPCLYKLRF